MELLIRVAGLNVEHETKDGATALTITASKRQARIVDMIQNMKNNEIQPSSKTALQNMRIVNRAILQ